MTPPMVPISFIETDYESSVDKCFLKVVELMNMTIGNEDPCKNML